MIYNLMTCITNILSRFEGMRALHIEQTPDATCVIKYVSITNNYAIPEIEHEISASLGKPRR